jgi:hypothetical protein
MTAYTEFPACRGSVRDIGRALSVGDSRTLPRQRPAPASKRFPDGASASSRSLSVSRLGAVSPRRSWWSAV